MSLFLGDHSVFGLFFLPQQHLESHSFHSLYPRNSLSTEIYIFLFNQSPEDCPPEEEGGDEAEEDEGCEEEDDVKVVVLVEGHLVGNGHHREILFKYHCQ